MPCVSGAPLTINSSYDSLALLQSSTGELSGCTAERFGDLCVLCQAVRAQGWHWGSGVALGPRGGTGAQGAVCCRSSGAAFLVCCFCVPGYPGLPAGLPSGFQDGCKALPVLLSPASSAPARSGCHSPAEHLRSAWGLAGTWPVPRAVQPLPPPQAAPRVRLSLWQHLPPSVIPPCDGGLMPLSPPRALGRGEGCHCVVTHLCGAQFGHSAGSAACL